MPYYRIRIDAELIVKHNDRDVVANRLRRLFREAKFDVNDIEWSIQHIKPAEAQALLTVKKGGAP